MGEGGGGAGFGEDVQNGTAGQGRKGTVPPDGREGAMLHNLPLLTLYFLGAWLLLPLGWACSAAYLLFCLGSNLLFIGTICARCRLYGRASCPSGYGRISARIASRRDPAGFAATFRRNIGAVALCWVFPLIGGALVLVRSLRSPPEALPAAISLLAFSAVGFYVLPAMSGKGCGRCPMRIDCPGSRVTVRE